jgi:hypothetical protein
LVPYFEIRKLPYLNSPFCKMFVSVWNQNL